MGLALLGFTLSLLPEGLNVERFPSSHARAAEDAEAGAIFDLPFARPDESSALVRLFAELDERGLAALDTLAERLEPLEPEERGKVAYAAARFAGAAGERALARRAYEEVAEDHALAPWAKKHLERLRSKPAEGAPAAAPKLTAEEQLLDDARRLMRARRFDLAHGRARRAAVRSKGAFRCSARLVEAQALAKLGKRDEERAVLERVIKGCDPSDDVITARFRAASSYASSGEIEPALAHYDALAANAPTSTLADDALFRGARLAREAGDVEGAITRMRAIIDVHPRGDMASDAAFELGALLLAAGRP